jgi:alpha-beta hydrolase superfamily lysophospholipase
MIRAFSAATLMLLLGVRAVPAQDPEFELALSHVVNDAEVASTLLSATASEVRAKGKTKGEDLLALLQRDASGAFVRYDRERKSANEDVVLSAVTVTFADSNYSLRERSAMGSRTKSVTGPSIDFVVDSAFPEVFIPYMLDPARKSVRVLLLPEMDIKTIVLEDRDRGRYAAVPGGGLTLITDAAGRFARLILPGPEGRVIVPAAAASRPRVPKENEVRAVLDKSGGVKTGFTLTLPLDGSAPFPAVVLIADAGPRDRNGAGGGSLVRTLKRIADALAAKGIATLRADKRGVGESLGPDPGLAALVDDARGLVEAAASNPAIDKSRIFVAGHGEGAIVATELARTDKDKIRGVISLASPARPLPDALEAKLRVRLSAAGQLPEAIESAVATLRTEMAALQKLPENAELAPGQSLLRDLVRIDPAVLIAGSQVPMLVIHAGDDRETPASQVALMRASLAFSDRARFELVEGADHDLLETSKAAGMTGADPVSSDVARPLHPRIPALIGEFVERPPATATRPSPR